MAIESLLCCFNSKTAMYLEKINFFITGFLIFLYILKLCIIPWGATSFSMEFIGVLLFIFIAINLVFVFLFFMLRMKNMIAEDNYRACIIISLVMIAISLLSFFFEFLQMIVVLRDLYKYTGTYYTSTNEVVVSNAEWFIAFCTITPSLILWFIVFMLWVSECLRLGVKTYGAYDDYMNETIEVVIVNKKGNNKTNNNEQIKDKNNQQKIGDNTAIKPNNFHETKITYI